MRNVPLPIRACLCVSVLLVLWIRLHKWLIELSAFGPVSPRSINKMNDSSLWIFAKAGVKRRVKQYLIWFALISNSLNLDHCQFAWLWWSVSKSTQVVHSFWKEKKLYITDHCAFFQHRYSLWLQHMTHSPHPFFAACHIKVCFSFPKYNDAAHTTH